MHAMRAAIHSTLGSSPGSLTFNRDMFLNIPLIADWHTITQRREHLMNKNIIRENQKHRRYDYVTQQRVLEKKMEALQVRQKNQWTIQSPTDTCKWYTHNRVTTRHLRKTQHKKGYTVQGTHRHISH